MDNPSRTGFCACTTSELGPRRLLFYEVNLTVPAAIAIKDVCVALRGLIRMHSALDVGLLNYLYQMQTKKKCSSKVLDHSYQATVDAIPNFLHLTQLITDVEVSAISLNLYWNDWTDN